MAQHFVDDEYSTRGKQRVEIADEAQKMYDDS